MATPGPRGRHTDARPGHTPSVSAGTELVEFSPSDELARTMEVTVVAPHRGPMGQQPTECQQRTTTSDEGSGRAVLSGSVEQSWEAWIHIVA